MNTTDDFCAATRAAMSDSMDGQPLSPWRRFTVWAHTHFCPACRPVWRSLHATKVALSALRDTNVTLDDE